MPRERVFPFSLLKCEWDSDVFFVLLHYVQLSEGRFTPHYVRLSSEKENAHLNRSWARVKRYIKLVAEENSLLSDCLEADQPPPPSMEWEGMGIGITPCLQPLGEGAALPKALQSRRSHGFTCKVQEQRAIKIPSWEGFRKLTQTAHLPQRQEQTPEFLLTCLSDLSVKTCSSRDLTPPLVIQASA